MRTGLAASAIVVVSPILLGLVTVEEEEQVVLGEEAALVNETLSLGPCIRRCLL